MVHAYEITTVNMQADKTIADLAWWVNAVSACLMRAGVVPEKFSHARYTQLYMDGYTVLAATDLLALGV